MEREIKRIAKRRGWTVEPTDNGRIRITCRGVTVARTRHPRHMLAWLKHLDGTADAPQRIKMREHYHRLGR
jgi:hypothetical protein